MYYGTDLKLRKEHKHEERKMGKDKPRAGAAMGQGNGMGGYDASAVNKAMESVKGSGGKPEYYCGGSKMGR